MSTKYKDYPQDTEDFAVCEPDVVRPWLADLTYKQQTVLLSAIRGCDGAAKEDMNKKFVRAYRSVLLHNAAPRPGTVHASGHHRRGRGEVC